MLVYFIVYKSVSKMSILSITFSFVFILNFSGLKYPRNYAKYELRGGDNTKRIPKFSVTETMTLPHQKTESDTISWYDILIQPKVWVDCTILNDQTSL